MKRQCPNQENSYSCYNVPVKRMSILSNTPMQKKDQIQNILHQSRQKLMQLMHGGRGDLRQYVMLKNLYRHMKTELEDCNYSTCARYRRYWNSCVSGLYGTECPPESWEDTETSTVSADPAFDLFSSYGMETSSQSFMQTPQWASDTSVQSPGFEAMPGSSLQQSYGNAGTYNSCAVSPAISSPYTHYGYSNLQSQQYKPSPDCRLGYPASQSCSFPATNQTSDLPTIGMNSDNTPFQMNVHNGFYSQNSVCESFPSYTNAPSIPQHNQRLDSASSEDDDEDDDMETEKDTDSSGNNSNHGLVSKTSFACSWPDITVPSFDLVLGSHDLASSPLLSANFCDSKSSVEDAQTYSSSSYLLQRPSCSHMEVDSVQQQSTDSSKLNPSMSDKDFTQADHPADTNMDSSNSSAFEQNNDCSRLLGFCQGPMVACS